MRTILVLFQITLVIQYVVSTHVLYKSEKHPDSINKITSTSLEYSESTRSISELWNNIKSTAIKVWDSIKSVSQKTKEKIAVWMENVKQHGNETIAQLINSLKYFKENALKAIESALGTSEIVKLCIIKENNEIEKIITKIIENVSVCVAENMNKLSDLSRDSSFQLNLNDTDFIKKIEKKYRSCAKDVETSELCLQKVKMEIYEVMDDEESRILETRQETRNILDDLLDKIVTCSLNGLRKATATITNEVIQIIKCAINDNNGVVNMDTYLNY